MGRARVVRGRHHAHEGTTAGRLILSFEQIASSSFQSYRGCAFPVISFSCISYLLDRTSRDHLHASFSLGVAVDRRRHARLHRISQYGLAFAFSGSENALRLNYKIASQLHSSGCVADIA